MPQVFYDQEMRCSRVTSEEMTLITSEMLHSLNEYHAKITRAVLETKRIVSIDPAFGGDVCKIMGIEDGKILTEKTIRNKHDAAVIVMAAKTIAQEIDTKNFICDSINDGGVSEGLIRDEAAYNVQQFKSSHKPTEYKSLSNIKFANKRAEAYYYTSEQIRAFEVGAIAGSELLRQLPVASRYKSTNTGKLQIIKKEKIKEELSCSPDEAECFVMGIWGLQFVEPISLDKPNKTMAVGRPGGGVSNRPDLLR